ncbi:hypothetical protein [Alkaliphilus peptidifermentans]|uniref:Phage holin family Hol44, holin superfamily V n=1 Tax=Alkaliphilus peptidifermentans DSM 18978 TaxID=1120976 RepID=A0A1G5CMP2_9FIRM|nr:hypothetical protein [Alkaliphilus peptidifermentans]SCY03558.1 hypothetical protein SAMN03080606_00708 [Alkaliphilus peptidifermentans DSM 18978]
MTEIDWVTADFLATFYGAVFITNIITHFIKDYMPEGLDKKIITLFVAIFVTLANRLIYAGISISNVYISIINSFLVAAAAIGNYDIIISKMKKRELLDQNKLAPKKEVSSNINLNEK